MTFNHTRKCSPTSCLTCISIILLVLASLVGDVRPPISITVRARENSSGEPDFERNQNWNDMSGVEGTQWQAKQQSDKTHGKANEFDGFC